MPKILVCHWCNKPKKNVQLITESKSHGICPQCLRLYFGLTVSQMYAAQVLREQAIKAAKTKKRLERREAKKRRS